MSMCSEFRQDIAIFGGVTCSWCGRPWTEMCHNESRGKVERVAVKHGYHADLADIPLVQVAPGCRECNSVTYRGREPLVFLPREVWRVALGYLAIDLPIGPWKLPREVEASLMRLFEVEHKGALAAVNAARAEFSAWFIKVQRRK